MILKIFNLVMFVVMVVMNYLANALPINEKTTGQLSELYPNLFVPAGITFSIWGVIYLLLLIFVILQFRESDNELVKQIGWAFGISSALNVLWIVAWHFEYVAISLLIMIALLIVLIIISLKIRSNAMSFCKAAFGIYLGWISIATIANVVALLVSINWSGWGFSEQTWTILMIALGALIALLSVFRYNNPFFGVAILWAFFGIITRQQALNPSIVVTAIIGMGVVGAITIFMFLRNSIFAKE